MIDLAHISRRRYVAIQIFMVGSAAYVLSEPFWAAGGLDALLRGEGAGKGWWPIAALAAIAAIPMLARSVFRLARHRGPAVFIRDGMFRGYAWKRGVPISDIRSVTARRGNLLRGSFSMVTLSLTDGTTRRIPTIVLTTDAPSLAAGISDAVPHLKATPPSLS